MLQVKLFDCQHELDLEDQVNEFLKTLDEKQLLSIEYQSCFLDGGQEDTIYSYSALLLYRMYKKEENEPNY